MFESSSFEYTSPKTPETAKTNEEVKKQVKEGLAGKTPEELDAQRLDYREELLKGKPKRTPEEERMAEELKKLLEKLKDKPDAA